MKLTRSALRQANVFDLYLPSPGLVLKGWRQCASRCRFDFKQTNCSVAFTQLKANFFFISGWRWIEAHGGHVTVSLTQVIADWRKVLKWWITWLESLTNLWSYFTVRWQAHAACLNLTGECVDANNCIIVFQTGLTQTFGSSNGADLIPSVSVLATTWSLVRLWWFVIRFFWL